VVQSLGGNSEPAQGHPARGTAVVVAYRARVRMHVRAYAFKDIIQIVNKACAEVCERRLWHPEHVFGKPLRPPFYRFRYPPGTGL
jgi:hypothetical protein